MPQLVRGLALALATVATAAATAAAVVGVGTALRPALAAPLADECGGGRATSAELVRDLFVTTAVLRRRPGCSYGLVTAALRQGASRADWARGSIPVIPFPTHAPRTLDIRVFPRASTRSTRTSLVVLSAADLGEATFEVKLVLRGGRWLVDYWAPAGLAVAPSAA